MSRLGKKHIVIPKGTEVNISGNVVSIKGPVGALSRAFPGCLKILVETEGVKIDPIKETPEANVLWGTFSSHIFNMIEGVNKHFEKRLLIEGIGFKADVKGNEISLNVGFSHPVVLRIPDGLKVISDKNGILVSGADIEAVGDFAARLRAVKKPEPYKGKGIRYVSEVIRRKQGKKTV